MQTITTTQLRTKSKDLVNTLNEGRSVDLIHRSRVVGVVMPNNETRIKTINAKKLEGKIDRLGFPSLTLKEIDRRYRIAMMKKHGKGLR
ncbi:MAG: hypothetical protein A2868_00255 [Candidatus Levybacteria bacterium RIFCSPHIGHO2_01_FULL_40_15b]|nr:MAG: hypothetical protein A2868_00255 [Candidatus Levybacteria bacterium RIFCSPHIGHO2_01_FULL_40_15b]